MGYIFNFHAACRALNLSEDKHYHTYTLVKRVKMFVRSADSVWRVRVRTYIHPKTMMMCPAATTHCVGANFLPAIFSFGCQIEARWWCLRNCFFPPKIVVYTAGDIFAHIIRTSPAYAAVANKPSSSTLLFTREWKIGVFYIVIKYR